MRPHLPGLNALRAIAASMIAIVPTAMAERRESLVLMIGLRAPVSTGKVMGWEVSYLEGVFLKSIFSLAME